MYSSRMRADRWLIVSWRIRGDRGGGVWLVGDGGGVSGQWGWSDPPVKTQPSPILRTRSVKIQIVYQS